ncbi:MAG: ribosomal protein S18-alanine N-acetyltransferase [Holosporaceae bacterium]|jgi:ribosomal-protein-alanine N-acetyltransferase|nr:ribosomal protein S18-alanine N-acetyltransferase [Holosporaceae bacterium]
MSISSENIRIVSAKDSESLAEVHKKCFDDGWSAESFFNMLSSDVFFGFVYEKSSIDGFIIGKIVCDEVEIITFCVIPQFRNQGIGGALIKRVHNYAASRSASKIFLEVAEDNAAARKLYENLGYKKIAERKEYYNTKEGQKNATVMEKALRKDDQTFAAAL